MLGYQLELFNLQESTVAENKLPNLKEFIDSINKAKKEKRSGKIKSASSLSPQAEVRASLISSDLRPG